MAIQYNSNPEVGAYLVDMYDRKISFWNMPFDKYKRIIPCIKNCYKLHDYLRYGIDNRYFDRDEMKESVKTQVNPLMLGREVHRFIEFKFNNIQYSELTDKINQIDVALPLKLLIRRKNKSNDNDDNDGDDNDDVNGIEDKP